MNDLTRRFSLHHLLSSRTSDYVKGFEDCKKEVLEILEKDIQNCDLSWDCCDSRYLEKIKKL